MKKQIVLSISHHIYLTREERYRLHHREIVQTTGVNIPVWFHQGDTSEPAIEVFCSYHLENNPDIDSIIERTEDGYYINLPQKPLGWKRPELALDYWRQLTTSQQEEWYENYRVPINSEFLLDPVQGGGRCMSWSQNYELEKESKILSIKNIIEIKETERLLDSLG